MDAGLGVREKQKGTRLSNMTEYAGPAGDGARCFAPAAERNKGPILEVLRRVLPPSGLMLEIASGSGQHALHFAAAMPALVWQTSDPDAAMRASLEAVCDGDAPGNLRPPVDIDVTSPRWGLDRADAVVCINMIHIAPWRATRSLVTGAARLLPPGGPLVLYGPFRIGGAHTSPSNAAFDADLRRRDPSWGVRELEEVERLATRAGFRLEETVDMPANNLTVVFRA